MKMKSLMAILRVLPIIIILLLTTNCGGGSSGGGGATPSETENTDGTNGDNTPDNNPSDEEQGMHQYQALLPTEILQCPTPT